MVGLQDRPQEGTEPMEGIRNYYELQVTAQIEQFAEKFSELNEEDISDIACLALNQLPSRYFKHGVDLSFYTTPEEKMKMDQRIEDAIEFALEHVRRNPRKWPEQPYSS
ncbi:MAG: hypothetical protein GKR91_19420 [Pseudomonadales bacterium]|nr:hypothetical protein [Pseudomonadales bacterium]